MGKRLYTVEVPSVSQEFYNTLDKTFPVYVPKPGDTLEDIMYRAGQRNVVDFVLRNVTGKVTNINRNAS